jgi:hypothetical protein
MTARSSSLALTVSLALSALGCAPPVPPAAAPSPAPSLEPVPNPPAPTPSVFEKAAASTFYSLDVEVVKDPPPAVHLLSALDEGSPADCDAALMAHAKRIGANRLHVRHDVPGCRGGAYMVPPGPNQDEDYGWAMHRWLRSHWKAHEGLTAAQLSQLCVVTTVWTTSTLHVWKVAAAPTKSSGNPAFDESVRASLERVIDEKEPLPTPASVDLNRRMRHAMVTLSFTLGDTARCH